MAMTDGLIDEILAEHETRPILDKPIPEAEEGLLPWPLRPQWAFADLDLRTPPPVDLPAYEPWVEMLADAKDEFEVDGAATVFSTWRVEREDPLDIGDDEGIHSRMTDARAARLLAALPGTRSSFCESCFSGRRLKMNGSLKTSLIQSRLSERRAREPSWWLGSPAPGY